MPFGEKVQCYKCEKNESFMWHPTEKGVQCNDCYENELPSKACTVIEEERKPPPPSEKPKTAIKKNNTKTRSYKTRQNPNALPKQVPLKGKGRRTILKKSSPIKLVASRASFVTTGCVVHKGQYYRVGDIVSMRDVEGNIYYAQIQGLLMDQYCEKSASITWLIPTRNDSPFPKKGFDPLTFVSGPTDDLPRKLDCMEFVMHAPAYYFKDVCSYPSGLPDPRQGGFIWGRLK